MSYKGYDYPTDEQLKRIAKWPITEFFPHTDKHADYGPWFAYIKALWWMPDWGWNEYEGKIDGEPMRVFYVSTGGWSGNEDIIHAMQQHFIGWSQTFHTHRSGGHFMFMWNRRGEKPASDPARPTESETGTAIGSADEGFSLRSVSGPERSGP